MKRDDEYSFETLSYQPSEAEGECIILSISPIRKNILKFVIFVIVSILFVGIPVVLIHWYLFISHCSGSPHSKKSYTSTSPACRKAPTS